MSAVGKYRAMFSLGLQNTIIYRWNFLFRAISGLVPLLGGLYLWRALYQARDGRGIEGFDFSENHLLLPLHPRRREFDHAGGG